MRRNPQAGRRQFGALGLDVFTEDDLVDIHQATLEVLSDAGIFVEDADARRLFAAAGCAVDNETKVVRIPRYVVEAAIRSAPSTLVLAGRDAANDFVMGPGRVGFTNFGEGIKVVDLESGEVRPPTKQDVADSARVVDALPEVDVYERAVGAHEVPQSVAPLHNAEMAFTNTSKHVFIGPGNGVLLQRIVEMGAAIAGGMAAFVRRPLVSFNTCPVSPLKLVQDTCEIIMGAARTGTAVNILSMAMAGGSSPVTLAGTMVTHNAEVLAGVTLSQLTTEGAAVIYGSSTTAMDLRLAAASVGSPECALISAGVACLARFYLLPSWVAGAQGDGKIVDAQSGHEKTLTGLLPALAGANLIYGLGMLESGMTIDFGQLVLDHEIARFIKQTVAGIPVNDEMLMVEEIKKVGAFGDFLSLDSTMKYMRTQSQPKLIDRRVRDEWKAAGSTDVYQRAVVEARRILAEHRPLPLPDGAADEMRRIIEESEREFAID